MGCDNVSLFHLRQYYLFHGQDSSRVLDFYGRVLAVAPFPSNLVVIGMIFSYKMLIAYEFDSLPSRKEKDLHLVCLIALLLATAFSGQPWGHYAFFILNQSLFATAIVIGFY